MVKHLMCAPPRVTREKERVAIDSLGHTCAKVDSRGNTGEHALAHS